MVSGLRELDSTGVRTISEACSVRHGSVKGRSGGNQLRMSLLQESETVDARRGHFLSLAEIIRIWGTALPVVLRLYSGI